MAQTLRSAASVPCPLLYSVDYESWMNHGQAYQAHGANLLVKLVSMSIHIAKDAL